MNLMSRLGVVSWGAWLGLVFASGFAHAQAVSGTYEVRFPEPAPALEREEAESALPAEAGVRLLGAPAQGLYEMLVNAGVKVISMGPTQNVVIGHSMGCYRTQGREGVAYQCSVIVNELGAIRSGVRRDVRPAPGMTISN